MNFNREELEMLQDDSGGTFGSAYVKQLAADLLEARAMIREMRNGYDIIMSNTLNPSKTMTKLGLELTQEGNRTIAKRILEASVVFADE